MSPLALTFAVFGFTALVGVICFGKGREVGHDEGYKAGKGAERWKEIREQKPDSALLDAFEEMKEVLFENVCKCKIEHVINQHVKLYMQVVYILKQPEAGDESTT